MDRRMSLSDIGLKIEDGTIVNPLCIFLYCY